MSRRLIIGVGLLLWARRQRLRRSVEHVSQLFAVRMMGGIGGSGNAPATFSILADYFPPAKLPKALAVMNIGFLYGSALATAARWRADRDGFVAECRTCRSSAASPGPGSSFFCIMAIPDLLLGILVLTTLHEPGAAAGVLPYAATASGPAPRVVPVRDVFKFLYEDRAAFGPMFAGLCANALAMGALAWNAPFFMRTYGWDPAHTASSRAWCCWCWHRSARSPAGSWRNGSPRRATMMPTCEWSSMRDRIASAVRHELHADADARISQSPCSTLNIHDHLDGRGTAERGAAGDRAERDARPGDRGSSCSASG